MIDALIKRCSFTDSDIKFGLEGQCASFALALHNLLASIAIKTTPAVCVAMLNGIPERCSDAENDFAWYHVFVVHDGKYFDIKGQRSSEDFHAYYNKWFENRLVQGIYPTTVSCLERDIKDVKKETWNQHPFGYGDRANYDRYEEWFKRLKDNAYE